MSTPRFVDTAFAAEMLRVSEDAVRDLVQAGRLRPYGGRAPNFIFRTADVAALASDVVPAAESESPKRVKSPSARVQARLTADARWVDVSENDIRSWAANVDAARRQAARTVSARARQKLETLLQVLDELEPSG